MRIEKGYLSICLALTLAGQVLLAQVNLGDILRRRPVNPRVPNPGVGIPGRSLPGAGVSADKCKALVAWMSILEREYPQVDFRLTVVDRLYPRAVNLFRDEHFAPFYGKPFTQTTDTERRTYVQTVFRACGPNQLTPQEQNTF